MKATAVIVFDSDDGAYQQWAEANPDSYVLNTPRRTDPTYLTVHKATCRLVREYNQMARPGGFTERLYIKVCSENLEALRDWAEKHGGRKGAGFRKQCWFCMKMPT